MGSQVAGWQDGRADPAGSRQEDNEMELGSRDSGASAVNTAHLR